MGGSQSRVECLNLSPGETPIHFLDPLTCSTLPTAEIPLTPLEELTSPPQGKNLVVIFAGDENPQNNVGIAADAINLLTFFKSDQVTCFVLRALEFSTSRLKEMFDLWRKYFSKIVFWYSGHGEMDETSGFPRIEVKKGSVTEDEISESLRNWDLSVVIFDCCNAPGASRGLTLPVSTVPICGEEIFKEFGCIKVSSSSPGEYSTGSPNGGLFTTAFRSEFEKQKSLVPTLLKIRSEFMAMPLWNGKQTPQFEIISGFDGHNIDLEKTRDVKKSQLLLFVPQGTGKDICTKPGVAHQIIIKGIQDRYFDLQFVKWKIDNKKVIALPLVLNSSEMFSSLNEQKVILGLKNITDSPIEVLTIDETEQFEFDEIFLKVLVENLFALHEVPTVNKRTIMHNVPPPEGVIRFELQGSMEEDERDYIQRRLAKISQKESKNGGVIPKKIGICISGGGVRAAAATRILWRLLEKKQLLYKILYAASLSGSTWAVVDKLFFGHESSDVLNPLSFTRVFTDIIWNREDLSAVNDMWEKILHHTYFNNYKKEDIRLTKVGDKFTNQDEHPWPLMTAVDAKKDIFYEFSPSRIRPVGIRGASLHPSALGFAINIEKNTASRRGIQNVTIGARDHLSQLFSIFGSAMMLKREDILIPGFLKGYVPSFLEKLVILYAEKLLSDNEFIFSPFSTPNWQKDGDVVLELRDGGFITNIPILPLLESERDLDLIIALDVSGDSKIHLAESIKIASKLSKNFETLNSFDIPENFQFTGCDVLPFNGGKKHIIYLNPIVSSEEAPTVWKLTPEQRSLLEERIYSTFEKIPKDLLAQYWHV